MEPETAPLGTNSRTVMPNSLLLNDVSAILHLRYFAEGKTHWMLLCFIPKTAGKHCTSFLKRGEWGEEGADRYENGREEFVGTAQQRVSELIALSCCGFTLPSISSP